MTNRYFTGYMANQYEDLSENNLFLFNSNFYARYIKQEEPEFVGNLLIEALPPILNFDEFEKQVRSIPIYADTERNASREYRINAIGRLRNYVLPFTNYNEIYNKISIVIRRGYEGKKIMSPQFVKNLNQLSDLIHLPKQKLEEYREGKCAVRSDLGARYGFSIFGDSGTGKTTAINRILATIPQCIIHTGIGEEKYLFTQIPWLKIDCAYNGTVKGLCQNFFSRIDEILKTDYLSKYGSSRVPINRMIVAMQQLVQKHGVGLLVIDEIQHLANAKGQTGNALDFFVTLMNEIKVPIIFIGTHKAIPHVLAKEFTQARRSSGLGEMYFSNMQQDAEWDHFINELWHFQWTKEKVDLTQELKDIMYNKTGGIIDRVIALFMLAQLEAITCEKEKLTPNLIEQVAKKHMKLTEDMITALVANDTTLLEKFIDMKGACEEAIFEHGKSTAEKREKAKAIREEQKKLRYKEKEEAISEIVLLFSQLDYEYSFIEKIAAKVVNKYGIKKEIGFIKNKVAEEIFSQNAKKNSDKKEKEKSC